MHSSHFGRTVLIGCLAFFWVIRLAVGEESTRRKTPPKANRPPACSEKVRILRQKYLSVTDEEDVEKFRTALFAKASTEQLLRLRRDPNAGIALQALWQLRNAKDLKIAIRSNPERVVGELETRLGVPAPLCWSAMLHYDLAKPNSRQWHRAHALFGQFKFVQIADPEDVGATEPDPTVWQENEAPGQRLRETKDGILVPLNHRIDGDRLRLGEHAVPIHASFRQLLDREKSRLDWGGFSLRGVVQGDKCFCAVYDHSTDAFPLVCLDQSSGAVLWESTVRRRGRITGPKGYLGMVLPTPLWVVASDETVAVFGRLSSSYHYAEAFDVKSGENTCRWYAEH